MTEFFTNLIYSMENSNFNRVYEVLPLSKWLTADFNELRFLAHCCCTGDIHSAVSAPRAPRLLEHAC